MPRARQQGKPGEAYANRTDLNAASAPKTVPGQEYGKQAAQMAGMVKAPVARNGMAAEDARPAPMTAPPDSAQRPAGPAPAPFGGTLPGSLPWDQHSTERPEEPVDMPHQPIDTDGIQNRGIASLLTNLANTPGAPHELRRLSMVASALGGNH